MKRKTVSIIIFTLLHLIVLNISSNITVAVNASDGMSELINLDYFTVQDNFKNDMNGPDNKKEIYGSRFGKIRGQLSGYMDSINNKKNNWSKAIISDKEIIEGYSLNKETVEYRNEFLKSFKRGFKEAYEKAFRDENFTDSLDTKENGLVHGKAIGTLEGKIHGKLDYINGKNNNWRSSISSDEIIIEKYNLYRDSSGYTEGFLVGYKDGFRKTYNSTFRDQNLEIAESGLDVSYISMYGGEISSYDNAVKLKIEPGSFYEETGISIEKIILCKNLFNSDTIPATNIYKIRIQGLPNSINLTKPIMIEFEYYGPEKGGIYEFKNGKWLYLYSQIENNKIFTDINTDQYSGGIYAVLINEKYKTVDDIENHWAAGPIKIFLNRNYIDSYPDKTFRPNQSITRAEFIKILDSMFDWNRHMPSICTDINFRDSPIFGDFAGSILRAVSSGYVKGYEDNTFRPHIPITYQEVEWLVQRITGRYDFNWDTVAEKILNDYYVCSKSYNTKQNHITRAETVYLLYSLEEGLL